jgi:RNA polymerase sigma factor, sigma-70 family
MALRDRPKLLPNGAGGGRRFNRARHARKLAQRRSRCQLANQPDPGPSPEEEVFRKADINRVRTAVEAIPEPFREAVVLRDLEDLSYAEIAEVTGVPVGTVMSRLSRGRAMLAKELLPTRKVDNDEQSRSAK